ncbi:MAG: biotin--[acetyl-CoA-carboxylase] ligase [Alphaproteobacteria bacterium]|nr:MAG: biotin--[acetyl-CoA-carboxylase] ligase [Alphaproteobacteria bacterium]
MSERVSELPSGYRVFSHEIIDSTNEEAKRLAMAGDPGKCIVWAVEQTAGRGRRGRQWVSKPGNLFASILIRPQARLADASQLSFAAALAVKHTLEVLSQQAIGFALKWPNDVLVDGAKISGILLEGSSKPARHGGYAQTDYLIIGIGINLQHHPEDTPYPATDMIAATGISLKPEDVVAQLTVSFDEIYQSWVTNGFNALRQQWLKAAYRLGEPIEVQQNDNRIKGIMRDLDATGALRIEVEDGNEVVIHAGDVFFPAGA